MVGVDGCTSDGADALKYLTFIQSLNALEPDFADLGAVEEDMVIDLAEAYTKSKTSPADMITLARTALAAVPKYQALLDALAMDFDAMQRSVRFTANPGDVAALVSALSSIDRAIADLHQVGEHLQASAQAFLQYSYDSALDDLDEANTIYPQAWLAIHLAIAQLRAALTSLYNSAACKNGSAIGAALSGAQINRAAGGGGTQTHKLRGLSVMAPKHLKLQRRGTTKLKLTLTLPRPGSLELSLTRGKRLIITVHCTSTGHGRVGLSLNVPRTAAKSRLRLTVSFVPYRQVKPAATISLGILTA